jgi:hypothetical protein
MESAWGVDRLPSLVSPDTAARFGVAKAKLDQAIEAEDPQQVVRKAAVLMRGWAAMAEEAIAAGYKPLEVEAWAWESEGGTAFTVARSNTHAHALVKRGDIGGRIYSLEEICRIVEAVDKPGLIGGVDTDLAENDEDVEKYKAERDRAVEVCRGLQAWIADDTVKGHLTYAAMRMKVPDAKAKMLHGPWDDLDRLLRDIGEGG